MPKQKQANPQHKTAIKRPGGKRPVKVPKQPNMTGAYPRDSPDIGAEACDSSLSPTLMTLILDAHSLRQA